MPRAKTKRRVTAPSVANVQRNAGLVKSRLSIGSRLSRSPSSLAAAETVTTGAIIAYDVMGNPDKKLPRPGPIVATMGFFSLMGLAAAASDTFAPVIVASGWVLALAVLVTGRRGKGIVNLLNGFATQVAKLGNGGTG